MNCRNYNITFQMDELLKLKPSAHPRNVFIMSPMSFVLTGLRERKYKGVPIHVFSNEKWEGYNGRVIYGESPFKKNGEVKKEFKKARKFTDV